MLVGPSSRSSTENGYYENDVLSAAAGRIHRRE